MKHLFIVFCISLTTLISSTAAAWSPLEAYRSIVEPSHQCYSLVAGSEENQEENTNDETEEEEEEEEEPDCD